MIYSSLRRLSKDGWPLVQLTKVFDGMVASVLIHCQMALSTWANSGTINFTVKELSHGLTV
jgi:hypothetical protein